MIQKSRKTSGAQQRGKELFNGRTKILFDGPEPGTLVLHFKDSLDKSLKNSAPNAHGAINNRFSELMMQRLGQVGIETHFIKRINMREQLVRLVDPLVFRFRVHNIVVDELANRLSVESNLALSEPIIELYVRKGTANDTVISPQHVYGLGWAQEEELESLFTAIRRMNDFLLGQFAVLNLRLANYSLEFGRIFSQDFFEVTRFMLIDAFGLDSLSILDNTTGERLDSSQSTGTNWQGCEEVARRFGLLEYIHDNKKKSKKEAA